MFLTVKPPAGSGTDAAVPGAVMLVSVSEAPSLTRARNRLADWPLCRLNPSGAPTTNTLLIESWPTEAVAPSVGA